MYTVSGTGAGHPCVRELVYYTLLFGHFKTSVVPKRGASLLRAIHT